MGCLVVHKRGLRRSPKHRCPCSRNHLPTNFHTAHTPLTLIFTCHLSGWAWQSIHICFRCVINYSIVSNLTSLFDAESSPSASFGFCWIPPYFRVASLLRQPSAPTRWQSPHVHSEIQWSGVLRFHSMPTIFGHPLLFPYEPSTSYWHHYDVISTYDITLTSLWHHPLPMTSSYSTTMSSPEHYKYSSIS